MRAVSWVIAAATALAALWVANSQARAVGRPANRQEGPEGQ